MLGYDIFQPLINYICIQDLFLIEQHRVHKKIEPISAVSCYEDISFYPSKLFASVNLVPHWNGTLATHGLKFLLDEILRKCLSRSTEGRFPLRRKLDEPKPGHEPATIIFPI